LKNDCLGVWMQQHEFRRFSAALTACAELYGRAVSEGAMSLWWESLKRFEIEQVERAFRVCIESPEAGQYMPKPADLIRAMEGTSSDRSLLAWGEVFEAMSSVGAYRSVQFSDPAIHAAVSDMGGWVKLCRTETDELPFVQKRFCDAHKVYTQRGAEHAPAVLIGESDQQNAGIVSRIPAPEPVKIGARPAVSRISNARQLKQA